MRPPSRSFTAEVDGMILAQIKGRIAFTRRALSREASYLADLAFRRMEKGFEERVGPIHEPTRICLYMPTNLLNDIERHAQENHRFMGQQLNILLRTALDAVATDNEAMINAAGPSGRATSGTARTGLAA